LAFLEDFTAVTLGLLDPNQTVSESQWFTQELLSQLGIKEALVGREPLGVLRLLFLILGRFGLTTFGFAA